MDVLQVLLFLAGVKIRVGREAVRRRDKVVGAVLRRT
jgi:hypothetical protein